MSRCLSIPTRRPSKQPPEFAQAEWLRISNEARERRRRSRAKEEEEERQRIEQWMPATKEVEEKLERELQPAPGKYRSSSELI